MDDEKIGKAAARDVRLDREQARRLRDVRWLKGEPPVMRMKLGLILAASQNGK